jgi:acyl-CoA oxidase
LYIFSLTLNAIFSGYREAVFRGDDSWKLDLDATRARTFEKASRAIELFLKDGNEEKAQSRAWVFEMLDPSVETVIGVHYFLFRPAIEGSGTIEQIRKYAPDTIMGHLYGSFSMTEMGTGSNVPGIETTATYDVKTQEFIINTPSLTATKWWIGGVADISTHTILFARMIVNNEDHGIQMFVVQLRDMETHKVLPNIRIGDCGEKMGRHGIPNGWIQFDNLRIPRDQLLMRFVKVSPDGVVTKQGTAQQAYSALIGGRVVMAGRAANTLAHMLTIAIRYGSVRRQFNLAPGEAQIPILDYASHAHTLMPLLAGTYAIHFTTRKLESLYNRAKEMGRNNDFSLLSDIHTLSAGLKPFCTWFTHYGIDECRQACGGHGYSAYSRFAKTQESWAVMCTWEGSNMVLAQQLSQSLIKALQRGMMGKPICAGGEAAEKLTGMAYIRRIPEFMGGAQCPLAADSDWTQDPEALLAAWEYIPAKMLLDCGQLLQSRIGDGLSERLAWNASTVELVRLSKAHTYLFLMRSFLDSCLEVSNPEAKAALLRLFNLFALYHMEQHLALLLEDGYFNGDQAKHLRKSVHNAIQDVRHDAVSYVDAFSFTDFVVQSPLGRKDGNIYEHYFNEVTTQHPPRERPPWYESLIRPFFKNSMEMPQVLIDTLKQYEEEIAKEPAAK